MCDNQHRWAGRHDEHLGNADGLEFYGFGHYGSHLLAGHQVAGSVNDGSPCDWIWKGRVSLVSLPWGAVNEPGDIHTTMKCLLLLLLGSLSAFGQAFSPSDLPFRDQAGGTDWARRVVANGGAQPSANTVAAMETLRTTLIAQGITNKLYSLCIFVPDSVIAATTPLFKHFGSDPWTNFNFAVSNLTINGLKGDGTSKVLDTGVKPKDVQIPINGATIGLSVIVTESASNEANITAGYQDADNNPVTALQVSSAGVSQWYAVSATAATEVVTNDFARVGYVSGNRTTNGGTNLTLFVASPLESHKLLASKSGSQAAATTSTEVTYSVFANKHGETNRSWTSQRLSMACVHDGFTETESSNFWWAVKTCRESLGGGTGDNVHDWNMKIVQAGGANVSTTTSNALRTFYSGLDTDGLLYDMSVVNPYPPDNLTACRIPFIWQAGVPIWTNFNFAETNVSVNGITGNLTNKSFGTGIKPDSITNRAFSSTSAGISLLIYNIPASGNVYDFGMGGTVASSQFALLNTAGSLKFYCWKFVNVNQDFVTIAAPSPGATFAGFLSGNRTAATAIRLDWVTNGVHNIATNGAGTQTGSTSTLTNGMAMAFNVNNVVSSWSDHTVSFLAIHNGLTQTKSSNLWVRVNTLRTSFGGGVP